jgi:hypothetical protein
MLGNDLVDGVTLGVRALVQATATRKALIVIGDGNDTNNEAAKPQLLAIKKQASQQQISSYAIIYKSVISPEENVITTLVPGAVTMNSIDGVGSALAAAVDRITDRYYVTFDARDLPWDGHSHDLTLAVAGRDVATADIVLPASPRSIAWRQWRWLEELALGTLLVGLFAAVARWRVLAAYRANG